MLKRLLIGRSICYTLMYDNIYKMANKEFFCYTNSSYTEIKKAPDIRGLLYSYFN